MQQLTIPSQNPGTPSSAINNIQLYPMQCFLYRELAQMQPPWHKRIVVCSLWEIAWSSRKNPQGGWQYIHPTFLMKMAIQFSKQSPSQLPQLLLVQAWNVLENPIRGYDSQCIEEGTWRVYFESAKNGQQSRSFCGRSHPAWSHYRCCFYLW